MKKVVLCLSLFAHFCLVISDETQTYETVTDITTVNETDISTTDSSDIGSTASTTNVTKQTFSPTSISTQKLTLRTFSSQPSLTNILTKSKSTNKKLKPKSTSKPPYARRKKKRSILLIVLVILSGLFFIFACVVPYLKKKIKMSKLRHHLVPVYSFEAEGEDWETELLTEHKDSQQTDGTTPRATIVREAPQLRHPSTSSCAV